MKKQTRKGITSVGLDLSLTGTGLVILESGPNEDIIRKQVLIKSKKKGDRPIDELERICKIVYDIQNELKSTMIHIAVIEGMAFMAKNSTALVQLAALNYMVRKMLTEISIPFLIVAPTSLKKFVTGQGNAKKDVMLIEMYKRYGVTILDDNENDAYGLAQIGLAFEKANKDKLNNKQVEVINLLKKQRYEK